MSGRTLSPGEIASFRSLRKTAIVLLVLFRLDPKPVGALELANILDIDRKTAANQLHSLSSIGLAIRTSYHAGYVLTQGGKQLVLGSGDELLLSGNQKQLGKFSPLIEATGEFLPSEDSPQSATATESLIHKDLTTDSVNTEAEAGPEISPVSEYERRRQIVVARFLQKAGIGTPKRDQLAEDPFLKPRYVLGHILKAKADEVGTGMLIYRLTEHDDCPDQYFYGRCGGCGQPKNRHAHYCQNVDDEPFDLANSNHDNHFEDCRIRWGEACSCGYHLMEGL